MPSGSRSGVPSLKKESAGNAPAAASALERASPGPELIAFTASVSDMQTPAGVLDALDAFGASYLPVRTLGGAALPLRASDWRSLRLGRNAFLHSSVPTGWWEEYRSKIKHQDDPAILMARSSLMGFTWTETMQLLDPVGIDRWPYELGLKYGMRDALVCAVGKRWIVTYWSRQPLGNLLSPPCRILLFAAASFAALRLEQLLEYDLRSPGSPTRTTPRELAVLRLTSTGHQTSEIAKALGLGEETVRSHLKKAQTKLRTRNRAHAVAEALRHQLIP
jgi:DNA-binding CsgD family transcriptional regulator